MSEFVLLSPPSNSSSVYLRAVKATSEKHFSLVDSGYIEILSGSHDVVYERMRDIESFESKDCISLYCEETKSLIQTTENCLIEILEQFPDYLKNKDFL